MENQEPTKKIGAVSRKPVNMTPDTLVKTEYLEPGRTLPVVIRPVIDGLNPMTWVSSHTEFIETKLLEHGAILFRNFNVKSTAEFEQFIMTISGELLDYTYGSTPRSHVSGHIYTSTEYPADQSIPLHNEMSYSTNWPMKIWFFCIQAAAKGGETPIGPSRQVFKRIPPRISERFIQKKVMYVRNYGGGLDLPWQSVFQTESKAEVENYCRRAGIHFEWKDGNRLRTRQVCQAVAHHPKTGEAVWFNQAHLFHVSSLQRAARELLLSTFNEEDLPRNAYYGDGSPIESSVLDEIRQAYEKEAVIFPWRDGDILVLDNMLVAHGRAPFSGPRKVVVGMTEAFSRQEELIGNRHARRDY
jgi:alpha-ketoglutarate-dependent taurine dioxygenase